MFYKSTRVSLLGIFWLGAIMAPAHEGMAASASDDPMDSILVSCKVSSPKAVLPPSLCAAFITVVQQAYPKETVAPAPHDSPATLYLLTSDASEHSLTARLGWGAELGPERAIKRLDKPLDAPQITSFLRELLEITPRP